MDDMKYERLEHMLCEELEKIVDRGELSAGSLDIVDKLTHALKNVYKIRMGYNGAYSQMSGDWAAEMRGNYGRENSYNNGSYSRADGYSGTGYSGAHRGQHYVRGHYSYADAKNDTISQLNELMNSAQGRDREAIERAIRTLQGG